MSNNKSFWSLIRKQAGHTTFFSVLSKRGKHKSLSAWKAVPLSVEFDTNGGFDIRNFDYFKKQIKPHGYEPNSAEFNKARIADLEIRTLYSHFERFPTVETYMGEDERLIHPIAKLTYQNMLYFKPTSEAAKELYNSSFLESGQKIAEVFEIIKPKVEEQLGLSLDFFSVPKRRVSTFCYTSPDSNPIGVIPRMFSFGLEKIVPPDRIARELSSYKSAERFINPSEKEWNLPNMVKPFVTTLKVAIVGLQEDILDSILLFPSAKPKLVVDMRRIQNHTNLSEFDPKDLNIAFVSQKGAIEVVHREVVDYDELKATMGTIKLSLPSGVKLSGYIDYKYQAKDSLGRDVDAIVDFSSVARKGALALFCFKDLQLTQQFDNIEQVKAYFMSLPREKVTCFGREYSGWIVDLPVVRTNQRYTNLSKPKEVGLDLISEAILNEKFNVPSSIEREYQKIIEFRNTLLEIIREKERESYEKR